VPHISQLKYSKTGHCIPKNTLGNADHRLTVSGALNLTAMNATAMENITLAVRVSPNFLVNF